MKIQIIGLGYMGLPMAATVAAKGVHVHGVDINPQVVASVNAGKAHFSEKGLDALMAVACSGAVAHLSASAVPQVADVHVISVPTPVQHQTDGSVQADMAYVRAAAASLAPVLRAEDLVILESTSPLGATQKDVIEVVEAAREDLAGQVLYAFCPERAIPGDTLRELVENDRLIGGTTQAATEKAMAFYKLFVTGELHATDAHTAEMVKLVENTSRDGQIAFANELSLTCDTLGLNVWEVIHLANKHPRVSILRPGAGVGGHCIAIDPWFIAQAAPHCTPLIQQARAVNDGKPAWVATRTVQAIHDFTQAHGRAPTVALFGAAFKPDVDDFRESPAFSVIKSVQAQLAQTTHTAATLLVVEPNTQEATLAGLPNTPLENALQQADICVFLQAHTPFKAIQPHELSGKVVLDICGVWA